MTDARLEQLSAVEAIKQLKARYCLYFDARRWEALRDLLADDMRAVLPSRTIEGADAFVEALGASEDDHFHFAGMPVIEVEGDTARGLWAFTNRGALGHYQEEYRRVDGAWRITSMEQSWIHPPSPELLSERTGAFHRVAGQWAKLSRWLR